MFFIFFVRMTATTGSYADCHTVSLHVALPIFYYDAGQAIDVEQHAGSVLRLRKLDADYDPRDRIAAMNLIQQRHARGEVVTGLLHVDAEASDLHGHLDTVPVPLNSLDADELSPGAAVLETINAALR